MITRAAKRIDRHWVRATAFTVVLVGLVVAVTGSNWPFAVAALGICATSFGVFFLAFPGGSHFGIALANALAVYACVFEFFHDSNFHDASPLAALVALALPVLGFLTGCLARRRRIVAALHAHQPTHMGRLFRWLPGLAIVGMASFALPRLGMTPDHQGIALVLFMGVIGAIVFRTARDVVLVLVDVATVFEDVTGRLDRLVLPVMAFLTYYSLLVVVFACLYRIAEISLQAPQFMVHGVARNITFVDALYFSVVTLSTVGYGDITPEASLVRGLAMIEVIAGLLLLLFGFSEIMRTNDSGKRRGPPPPHTAPPSHP